MPRIFISYRRADSRKDASRLYDRLVEAFGRDNVFKDVDNIAIGSDFRGVLREAVAQCDILLAVIGQNWLTIVDETRARRLDNPSDFVRIEVETALERDSCIVIPILVDNAPMPRAEDLPLVLRELAFKNATQVRDDPDFHGDVTKLIRSVQARFGPRATTTATVDVLVSEIQPTEAPTQDLPSPTGDKNLHTEADIPLPANQFFKTRDSWPPLTERLSSATRTLDMVGFSLTSIAITHQGIIRELLDKGVEIRLIVTDPNIDWLQNMIADRVLEVETALQHRKLVNSALDNLLSISNIRRDSLRVRVLDTLPAFGYLGIDTKQPRGRIYCELYLSKIPLSRNPMWMLNCKTDRYWSREFAEQFEYLWNNHTSDPQLRT